MHRSLLLSLVIITSLLLVIGCLLTSCSTPTEVPEAAAAPAQEQPSSDEIRVAIFTVEKDERFIVEHDLHIIAEEMVVVRGEIVGKHGATIEITAPSIAIHGSIQAGDGDDRDGVLEHGQDGGSIILNAPHINLTGATLASGHGGAAGPAGNGGHGGNIVLNDFVNVIGPGARLVGGNGGSPGDGINGHGESARHGGTGGNGGSTIHNRAPREAG